MLAASTRISPTTRRKRGCTPSRRSVLARRAGARSTGSCGAPAWTVAFVLSLVAMVYVHNWALFLCVGLAVATVLFARDRLAPSASRHSASLCSMCPGCPRCSIRRATPVRRGRPRRASTTSCSRPARSSAATRRSWRSCSPAASGSRGRAPASRPRADDHPLPPVAAAVTITLAWIVSQISPAWTSRYFAIMLGPLIVLAAYALVRGGRLGQFALVAVIFLWGGYSLKDNKENARQVSGAIVQSIRPGRARHLHSAGTGAALPLLPGRQRSGSRRRSARCRTRRSSTGAT